jgi:2-polyprenyl-6-methoxyphenol hydroxylase-like FAD-dependent oxidoreductase
MNSGLVEARELATRLTRILRGEGPEALLQEFATETRGAWNRILGAGDEVRALPGADPWVREARARIVGCLPASGDTLEPLLNQIGLTAAS